MNIKNVFLYEVLKCKFSNLIRRGSSRNQQKKIAIDFTDNKDKKFFLKNVEIDEMIISSELTSLYLENVIINKDCNMSLNEQMNDFELINVKVYVDLNSWGFHEVIYQSKSSSRIQITRLKTNTFKIIL